MAEAYSTSTDSGEQSELEWPELATAILLAETETLHRRLVSGDFPTPKESVFGTIRLQILSARKRGDVETERALIRALSWEGEIVDG